MKKIVRILMMFCMATAALSAQEKKAFTLNDVIPGGDNYYNLVPKNMNGLKWWGDVCVRTDVEEVKTIDKASGKESPLFTLADVNAALKGELPYKPSHELKPMRTLQSVIFPWAEKKVAVFIGRSSEKESSMYSVWYDFGQKAIVNLYRIEGKNAANLEFCRANGCMAYTCGESLYIASEGEHSKAVSPVLVDADGQTGIVYGQAVHRNEFGISKGTFWSPKGTFLAFYRMDQSMVTDYPQVNTTTRIATLEADKYPMAGMTSHKVTVGVYEVKTGKTVYLQAGDPTDRYFTNVSWSPDEKSIYVIELNRDQNHSQLVRYNAQTGAKEAVLYEEEYAKYVEPMHPLTFLPWDDTQFIYQSQRDGYSHLYLMDTKKEVAAPETREGKLAGYRYRESLKTTALTQGEWLVQDILGFNKAKKEIIIATTEVSPLQTNVFSLNVKTGKRTLIGEKDGNHTARISESGAYLIDNFTSNAVPRVVSLLPTAGKKGVTLFTATDPLKEQFELPEITVGTLKAADGVTDLYYRLVKPVHFDASKKYPAVIYVYGGPHAQMIHNVRFYDARGWDLYMAQLGYVVFTVDSRGSDNRGLAFENCTFRQLGTEEMKDQVQGAKFLQALPYVDGGKIGVHGWSFGGFMTTNLMLTYPDIFKVGVAGGPVIDWQFYEVMYGERYMDTPQANPEGYKNANLRNKAGQLKGRLEVIIGGEDPTCVPQHSYTFLRACIDAGTHPDFFVYPEDGHNMFGRDRVHLHEHITRYFEDHLK